MRADVAALSEREARGFIRRRTTPDGALTVWAYTEHCVFERAWDEHTTAARGLVTAPDGEVVGLPFPKFFNLGEPSAPTPPDEPFDVYEKVDGSLGVAYHDGARWRVSTKCSFANPYVEYAETFRHLFAPYAEDVTLLVEIVLPAGADAFPRAVAHEPGLYLLGARNRRTGEDYPLWRPLQPWRGRAPRWHRGETLDSLVGKAAEGTGTEGWVVRFRESATRLKVKTAWYLRLFRAVHGLTSARVRALMVDDPAGRWLADFPEELRPEAEALARTAEVEYLAARAQLRCKMEMLAGLPTRKDFALAVKDDPDKAYLFMLRDGDEGRVRRALLVGGGRHD